MFFKIAMLVLKKDIAIELRSYEILSTTLFFAAACVTIFSFAFAQEDEAEAGREQRQLIERELSAAPATGQRASRRRPTFGDETSGLAWEGRNAYHSNCCSDKPNKVM